MEFCGGSGAERGWGYQAVSGRKGQCGTVQDAGRTAPGTGEYAGRVEQMVRQDIIRLRYLVAGQVEQDAVSAAVKRMNLEELLAFQEKLRVQQKAMCAGQLGLAEKEQQGNAAFRV